MPETQPSSQLDVALTVDEIADERKRVEFINDLRAQADAWRERNERARLLAAVTDVTREDDWY